MNSMENFISICQTFELIRPFLTFLDCATLQNGTFHRSMFVKNCVLNTTVSIVSTDIEVFKTLTRPNLLFFRISISGKPQPITLAI